MKPYYPISLCLLLVGTACTSVQEESVNTERPQEKTEEVFYATLEQSGVADATKVYADENLKVLWNANDRISIFKRYTYGYEYAFQGATGDTAGAFVKEEDDAEFVTGNPLDKIYAVYPYSADNKISNSGNLSILWPSMQTYKPESFGIGSNVMVSVTTNNQLRFRNVGGYLALKLYGDNVSVTSITLRGNNGEKLSGKASIACATDEDPTLSFDVSAQGSLRLNCAQPVTIGTTAEDATVFWLVVPPTQFTEGFNITVCTSDGGIFVKSTDTGYDIERNTLCRMAAVEVVPGDIIPFEDANFKAYCVENFDTNGDGEISVAEALAVTTIDVNTDNIVSLQGVEFFKNLTSLSCCGSYTPSPSSYNGSLNSLDISDNVALTELNCYYNQLASLDVSRNTALTHLRCHGNQLSSLDVSHNEALISLACYINQLSALDVTHNTSLTQLYCYSNQLAALDVSNNTLLSDLLCQNNQLAVLDVSNNTALTRLSCLMNQLTSLDVSSNTELTYLSCTSNQLTALDVANNTALTELYCRNNQLTALNVTNNTALTYFSCGNNQLSILDVSHNLALSELVCNNNPYLTEIWLKIGQTIESFWYDSSVAQIHYVGLNDIISFADANFKAYCVENFDTDDDGEITVAEALEVTSIEVNTDNIESLQGVEFFTNLTALSCRGSYSFDVSNGSLAALDVSNNTALQYLRCDHNQLTTLDVSNNTSLDWLGCSDNQLSTLDVSNNTALTWLGCSDNQLSTLNVSNNTALIYLYCNSNLLTALDVSNNTVLNTLWCFSNQLTTLGVSNNTDLEILNCGNNLLTSLDVSNNTELIYLDCIDNQLTTLEVGNNTALENLHCGINQLTSLDVSNNTALIQLGCDNNQLTSLDVSNHTALETLSCGENQLTTLNVSNDTVLTNLYCYNNQLTTLDVSDNTALEVLECYNNFSLTEIWLKTGQSIETFNYGTIAQIKYKD